MIASGRSSGGCRVCGTPLSGPRGRLLTLAGIRRSRKNPNLCNRCDGHLQEGRLQEVTILFADLSGFTALTHELGPQEIQGVVGAFLERASAAVVAEDGFVEKFIGDALMAVFNLPIARADHAAAGFRAAAAIQAGMAELSAQQGRPLQATVGLACGHVRMGRVGHLGPQEATPFGDVVNRAARLQSRAAPGEIILDAQAYAGIQALVPGLAMAHLLLKGFPEPVECYRWNQGPVASTAEERVAPRRLPLGSGSLLMALLGAPCAASTVLSPLALVLGLASAGAAGVEAAPHGLDAPALRLPLLALALAGSCGNLLVAFLSQRANRIAPRGLLPPTRADRNRTRLALALSALALVVVVAETVAHHHMHGVWW